MYTNPINELPQVQENSFQQLYKENYESIPSTQGKPIAIFCGGQPGSGKSAMTDSLKNRLKDAVVVDIDDYRTFHPDYEIVMRQNPDEAYSKLDDFSYKSADRIIAEAIKDNKNIIFDGTMGGQIEISLNTAKKLKDAGFELELAVLAVNPEVSMIGTFFRFEKQFKQKGYGRTVDPDYHNSSYNNIPTNLERFIDTNMFDEASIYGRDYAKKDCVILEASSLKNATGKEVILKSLDNERKRRLEPFEFASLKSYKESTKSMIVTRLQQDSSKCSKEISRFNSSCRTAGEKKDISMNR